MGIIQGVPIRYTSFKIPKRNGTMREIDAPCPELKKQQRAMLSLLYTKAPSRYATGFRRGYNILMNAIVHTGARVIINIDLKDFFSSIKTEDVEKMFIEVFGYSKDIAKEFAEYCTYNGRLPQGAPTSPAITNLIMKKIDERIGLVCKKMGFIYSRYADDITISSTKHINYTRILRRVINIIDASKLAEQWIPDVYVNKNKIRVYKRGQRMMVTGLTVSEHGVSVPRPYRKRLRAELHHCKMTVKNGGKIPPEKINELRGKIAFVHMVNPKHAIKFWKDFEEICGG
jgi:retron-type reverse transcriptase